LTTAKKKCRKFEANIPRKGISGPQSQFPHSCVCERIIYSHDGAAVSAGGNMWTDPGNIEIAHRHMNVEIGAEAAQFPEKEYINGIAFAVTNRQSGDTMFLSAISAPLYYWSIKMTFRISYVSGTPPKIRKFYPPFLFKKITVVLPKL